MTVTPHSGIVDFGVFLPPVGGQDGQQGEVPAPLNGQAGYFLSTDGWVAGGGGGGGGTVTQVNTSAPITGGPFTTSGTVGLAANGVTNAFLAQMPTLTLKGNNTGGTANALDLTAASVKTMLAISTADVSGLGALATQSTVSLSTQATGTLQAGQFPALTGDVTTAGGALATTIAALAVTTGKIALLAVDTGQIAASAVTSAKIAAGGVANSNLAVMAATTFKANLTGGSASPTDITGTQATALLDAFTTALKGLAPASGGGTTNFLRADGTWAAPPATSTLAWSAITGTPTTIAGYGIVDGVTLTGVQTLTNKSIVATQLTGTLQAGQFPALTGDVTTAGGALATTIAASAVTNAKMAVMAANTFKANNTGGSTNPTDITTAQAKTLLAIASTDVSGLGSLATASSVSLTTQATGTLQAAQEPAHTGDVTNTAGSLALTIANNVVTNAKSAQMAALTIRGNNTGGTANVADLTVAQVNAILPVVTGTLNGLAPLSGGGTTNYLRADGTWASPSGGAGGGLTQPQTIAIASMRL